MSIHQLDTMAILAGCAALVLLGRWIEGRRW
jgi:hypothetical protein